jgi:hypothetical protein
MRRESLVQSVRSTADLLMMMTTTTTMKGAREYIIRYSDQRASGDPSMQLF